MKHRYRKGFDNAYEAQEKAQAFHRMPGIDGRDGVEVSIVVEEGRHWVHVVLEGEVDPDEVLLAPGYERVDQPLRLYGAKRWRGSG